MLVLTRKIGESIQINENIKITVLDVKGRNIRLGVESMVTSLTRPIRLGATDASLQLPPEAARQIVYNHGVPQATDSVCSP